MRKFILVLLVVCTGCGAPLFKAEVTSKVPFISVGNRYSFYNSWGLEPGVAQCDTIEVTGHKDYCVYFNKGEKKYIMDERKFKRRMKPLGPAKK